MTPEKLFHQMLGLGNEWQVGDCRFDENNGVFLEIKETAGFVGKIAVREVRGPADLS